MVRVKLGDVAVEKRETWAGSTQGVPIVGLEHLVPGQITLSSWDSDSDNTFSKMFRKNQVLLGRRRVYLKKAVIAPFDGICSGDITVIEAIPGKISSRLLPFVIQNERFFDYAMQGSAGSLSPRVKWEHLKDYEFSIPSYSEQDILADKIWAALKLKESYQALLLATDEMVKSRFIEMFGDLSKNTKGWPTDSLGSIAEVRIGPFGSLLHQDDYCVGGHPLVNPSHIIDNQIVPDSKVAISDNKFQELHSYQLRVNDVVLGRRGEMGRAGIVKQEGMVCGTGSMFIRAEEREDSFFIHQLLITPAYKETLERNSVGTTMMNLNISIVSSLTVPILPHNLKKSFIGLSNQVDKSKFELKQAIEKIDKVMRALMQ